MNPQLLKKIQRNTELETGPEWNRAALLETADFTYRIGEIDLEPICAYRFTSYPNLKEEHFQYGKWICTLMSNITRSGSTTLNDVNARESIRVTGGGI